MLSYLLARRRSRQPPFGWPPAKKWRILRLTGCAERRHAELIPNYYCFRNLILVSRPRAEFHANLRMFNQSGAGGGLPLCCVFGAVGSS